VQSFTLIPFRANDLPQIQIRGEIERIRNRLSIHYSVTGKLGSILLPSIAHLPFRKHDLWKATCFEFFIAFQDQPRYWEFNLSPSSDWNVYAMDAYRQVNMREETRFPQLPFEFVNTDGELSLDVSVDLSPILARDSILQIGITAIIQTQNGNETYWALSHPGAPTAQADFHLRESFAIEL
jgi:hypothetical protein